MIYIAFTLGLFGSLHCLGMCGPLAFALLSGIDKPGIQSISRVIAYNIGRVISYLGLGIIAGITSSALDFAGLQKPLSILVGVVMIGLFIMSLDIERILFKSSRYAAVFERYRTFLSNVIQRFRSLNSISVGILNGLLPCGLVYLALAGALTSGSISSSATFMLFFGLGTFPAMIILLTGTSFVKLRQHISMRKVFSYLQLFVGLFLIYRSIVVKLPDNLELYWSMGKLMCH